MQTSSLNAGTLEFERDAPLKKQSPITIALDTLGSHVHIGIYFDGKLKAWYNAFGFPNVGSMGGAGTWWPYRPPPQILS